MRSHDLISIILLIFVVPFQQIPQIFSDFLNPFKTLVKWLRIDIAVLTKFAVDMMDPWINDDPAVMRKLLFESFLNVFHAILVRNRSSSCRNINEQVFGSNMFL